MTELNVLVCSHGVPERKTRFFGKSQELCFEGPYIWFVKFLTVLCDMSSFFLKEFRIFQTSSLCDGHGWT